jgi:hypothetical protein
MYRIRSKASVPSRVPLGKPPNRAFLRRGYDLRFLGRLFAGSDILRVEIAVSEKEIADVKAGQRVRLRAKAFPLQEFQGTVVGIAPAATVLEAQRRDPRTIRVVTELENPSGLLKPEMTGHAKIYGDEKRLGEIATRRFVRFFKVEFWSWW